MTAERSTARPRRAGRDGDVVPARRAQRPDPRDVGRAARHRPRPARRRPGGGGPGRGPGVLRRPRPRRWPAAPATASLAETGHAAADEECADRIAGSRRASPGCTGRTSSRSRPCRVTRSAPGFQLALACDLRVLADDAQLTMAEVTLGLVPDLGGTKRLVDLVGYARALEICVTGRRVDAAEAERIGLATVVVPAEPSSTRAVARPGRGRPRRQPGRGGGDQGAARRRRRAVRAPSSAGPSGRRRSAGCATSAGDSGECKERSGRAGLPPRLS